MKRMELTKKIPTFNAYQWDGTVESYAALVAELGNQAVITYHLNKDHAHLTVEDSYLSFASAAATFKPTVLAGQFIVFFEGVQVMTEESLKQRFDVLVEKTVYTGRLNGGPLAAWNETTIRGPLEMDKDEL